MVRVMLPLVGVYQHVGKVQDWSTVAQSPVVVGHKSLYRGSSGMNSFRHLCQSSSGIHLYVISQRFCGYIYICMCVYIDRQYIIVNTSRSSLICSDSPPIAENDTPPGSSLSTEESERNKWKTCSQKI